MVTLSRSADASPDGPTIHAVPTEAIISKIFDHSFEQIAEMAAVLCGSAKEAEALVARSLAQLATHRLTDEPERNLTKLRAKTIEALRDSWTASPTVEELRHSPLALVRSLPFEQAVAFVLRHFSGQDNLAVGTALNRTEAGARHHYEAATATILRRLIKPVADLVYAFADECEGLALQVDADPEILARILRDLPDDADPRAVNERYRKSSTRLGIRR
jgi:hypothetical protein